VVSNILVMEENACVTETQLPASFVDYRRGDDDEYHDDNDHGATVSVEHPKYPLTRLPAVHPV
jgi:hypothetical protein